jgi:hypothetical protein
MVLTWLDRSRRDVLVTRPGDNPHSPPAGVFSTRPPGRPNPIGLHRVRDHGRRITGSRARPGSARWDAACRCENRYWTKPPDDSDIAGTPCPCPYNAFSRGYTPAKASHQDRGCRFPDGRNDGHVSKRGHPCHPVRAVGGTEPTAHRTKRGIMRVIFEHLRPPGRIAAVRVRDERAAGRVRTGTRTPAS